MNDSLQDYLTFINGNHLQDGMIPMYVDNGTSCYWTGIILPTGTVDCAFVQSCMQSIIDGINTTLSNHTSQIFGLDIRISTLEGIPHHTHPNLSDLDLISFNGNPNFYLGGDGALHSMAERYGYYNRIETTGGGSFSPEQVLAFDDSQFVISEDPANGRTIIMINSSILGGSGGALPDGNDYVVSGAYSAATNLLALTRTDGGIVNIDLSALQEDGEDEFVDAATFNPTTNELTLERNIGTDLVVDLSSISLAEKSQSVASQGTVNINHALGRHPNFVCVDMGGNKVNPGNIQYIDSNNVSITFSPAFSGNIYRL